MSTDCWLSDSSVRPDGGDQKGEGQQQAPSQISSTSFCFSRKHNTEVSSVIVSHPRLHGRGFSMNDCLVTPFWGVQQFNFAWKTLWCGCFHLFFWLPGVQRLNPDGTCTTLYAVNILALGSPTSTTGPSAACSANPMTESTLQNRTASQLIRTWSHALGRTRRFRPDWRQASGFREH